MTTDEKNKIADIIKSFDLDDVERDKLYDFFLHFSMPSGRMFAPRK